MPRCYSLEHGEMTRPSVLPRLRFALWKDRRTRVGRGFRNANHEPGIVGRTICLSGVTQPSKSVLTRTRGLH